MLNIHRAANIRDTETFGKQDPYVTVLIDGDKRGKSKVHQKGGTKPVWDYYEEFDLDGKEHQVELVLFNKEVMSDDFIGKGVYPIKNLIDNAGPELWWNLDVGVIRMTVNFKGTLAGTPLNTKEAPPVVAQPPPAPVKQEPAPVVIQRTSATPIMVTSTPVNISTFVAVTIISVHVEIKHDIASDPIHPRCAKAWTCTYARGDVLLEEAVTPGMYHVQLSGHASGDKLIGLKIQVISNNQIYEISKPLCPIAPNHHYGDVYIAASQVESFVYSKWVQVHDKGTLKVIFASRDDDVAVNGALLEVTKI